MSTPAPNPVLKAAAPTLISALTDLGTLVSTVLSGDPLTAPARVGPAAQIFLGQLGLLLPELGVAEIGTLNTDVQTKIAGLITKLKAL
jgi:hypothetical protein